MARAYRVPENVTLRGVFVKKNVVSHKYRICFSAAQMSQHES